MDSDVPVGSTVDFTILLPGEVVGSRGDVQIDCRGRVVRSFEDRGPPRRWRGDRRIPFRASIGA